MIWTAYIGRLPGIECLLLLLVLLLGPLCRCGCGGWFGDWWGRRGSGVGAAPSPSTAPAPLPSAAPLATTSLMPKLLGREHSGMLTNLGPRRPCHARGRRRERPPRPGPGPARARDPSPCLNDQPAQRWLFEWEQWRSHLPAVPLASAARTAARPCRLKECCLYSQCKKSSEAGRPGPPQPPPPPPGPPQPPAKSSLGVGGGYQLPPSKSSRGVGGGFHPSAKSGQWILCHSPFFIPSKSSRGVAGGAKLAANGFGFPKHSNTAR